MQVVGLVHDLGKLLYFLSPGCGQWSVVGDTFPVGCAFSEKIIYPKTFAANPDSMDAVYSTKFGIYKEFCGLDQVMLSWGHDEVRLLLSDVSTCQAKRVSVKYLYMVLRDQCTLPEEGLAMIRYHSFYP